MNKSTAAEMLSMLNPKPCSFTDTGRGGVSSISPLDIAAALAGLSDMQNYLLRAKYADDIEYLHRAGREMVLMMSERHSVHPKPDEFSELQNIADYVVMAVVQASRCKPCEGTGTRINPASGPEVCNRCAGTGKKSDSASRIADQCGYHHNTFRDRGYIEFVKAWISDLYIQEDKGLYHVAYQLTDSEVA
jgi:hypothetical protein